LTVEEAIKAIMSVGIVTPHALTIPLSSPKSEKESVENFKRIKVLNPKIEGGP
jgi:uncharacterized membrane protein